MKQIKYVQYIILFIYLWQEINSIFKRKYNAQGYLIHNNAPASKIQFKLAKILGVKNKYINYKVGPYYADICMPRHKIIFEYDGYYWHKNSNKEKDKKRKDYLISRGYRLIHIKSNNKLPTRQRLKTAIEKAKAGKLYQTIILDDWGK